MVQKKDAKPAKDKAKPSSEKAKPQESQKGFYHFIKQAWKKPDKTILRERMIEWRNSPNFARVEKPLRLDKARALGYKAKNGFVVVRAKLVRGGHKRPRPVRKRRSKRMHTRKNLTMNYKWIAEQRVARKYPNLEVLNSYLIGKDGVHYFFEVICVDPEVPEIKSDKNLAWITSGKNRGRVMRGLTSSAKKARGLRNASPMAER